MSDEFVKVMSLSEIQDGEVKSIDHDGEQIALVNTGAALYAVSNVCTHAFALLSEGGLDARACELVCPRHGARFDIKTGKALCLPAVTPLSTWDVEVRDGDIYVSAKSRGQG